MQIGLYNVYDLNEIKLKDSVTDLSVYIYLQ